MTKKILDELCAYLNLKNYRELAVYLGIPVSRVYSWKKYGKITDVGIILVKNKELNPGWLLTGQGGMLDENPQPTEVSKRSKIAATMQFGESLKKREAKPNGPSTKQETESINEEEAIEQTRYILRSDTVYRGALISNIRAFYQGAKREEEMQGVSERMAAMQSQMDYQSQIIKRMEKMLEKITGDSSTKEKISTGRG